MCHHGLHPSSSVSQRPASLNSIKRGARRPALDLRRFFNTGFQRGKVKRFYELMMCQAKTGEALRYYAPKRSQAVRRETPTEPDMKSRQASTQPSQMWMPPRPAASLATSRSDLPQNEQHNLRRISRMLACQDSPDSKVIPDVRQTRRVTVAHRSEHGPRGEPRRLMFNRRRRVAARRYTDNDRGAVGHAIVEVDHVLIEQPDTPAGDGLANAQRFIRAM